MSRTDELRGIEKGLQKVTDLNRMAKIQANLALLKSIIQKDAEGMAPIEAARPAPAVNRFSTLQYPAYLMCPPLYVSNAEPNNPWMKGGQPFDMQKAYAQFLDLYTELSQGGMVFLLPPQGELQDEVYTANVAMTLPHTANQQVILANFRSAPRGGEEDVARDFFNTMEFDIVQCPFFWEGQADTKYLRENIYIGGHGVRTAPESYPWMAETFGMNVIGCKMNDPKLYHFDTQLFADDGQNVLAVTEIFDPADLKNIEAVANVIDVPLAFGYMGTTNCVRCGSNIIMDSSYTEMPDGEKKDAERQRIDWMNSTLDKLGKNLITVNLSEFAKSGANASCFVADLNYFSYRVDPSK